MPRQRALVWFKRDLRIHDHAALASAQSHGDALALFVLEPEWLQSPECDARHVGFVLDCLAELRVALAGLGMPLLVRVGSAVPMLAQLHQEVRFTHLLSHEETGPAWSYQRDGQVAVWCRSNQIAWQEFTQTGVVRRLRSRAGWALRWQARMGTPLHPPPAGDVPLSWGLDRLDQPALPTLASLGLAAHGTALQAAGETAARHTIKTFLQVRGLDYRHALSSPLRAEDACSRLSPHLAFGTLSLRTVHQATEATIRETPNRALAHALRGFAGRLRWHCHFMQKLEDEPGIEFHNFARMCDGLRENDFNDEHFAAWCEGRTGYPMVDACMRALRATGWLNFRMRAMLVSFASYHLWLHWRQTGLFLARQFLDFEPGIHWSQMQMQSGTTGINTLRIYSPTKQAQDHDPDGTYVRRWVPEFGTPAYPKPIVGERAALATAKERLYGLRRTAEARQEADAIQQRHGSRKSGLPRSGLQRRGTSAKVVKDVRQQELF